MSATWTDDELRRIGAATELQIATRRDDGSLRPYVTGAHAAPVTLRLDPDKAA